MQIPTNGNSRRRLTAVLAGVTAFLGVTMLAVAAFASTYFPYN